MFRSRATYILVGMMAVIMTSCNSSTKKKQSEKLALAQEITSSAPIKPIMLDDIHYYTLDREACNQFFETNFHSRPMVEDSPNPFEFIDFQLVRKGQSTVNISASGPFPGIKVGDPKRWEREVLKPSPENPPKYGVHWLAFGTTDLEASQKQLLQNGVTQVNADFKLPHSDAKAALFYGPDYNWIVVVENTTDTGETTYHIDHLLLLVSDLGANKQFYEEVFGAEEKASGQGYVVMNIADHTFVLTEPEALGIDRATVAERDPKIFQPNIDHLGFLYEDVRPAYEHAVSKGHTFLSEPIKIQYYAKPTLYTFAITFSPDGLQCELFQEEGRTGSRETFKK